jgi:membrane-bound lytic murein transglycosylase D
MKGTAKLYGLQVKRGNDERRDPYKATAAAAAYLKDLYNIYGSWYLAIASYNAGEGRIRNAILRHRERNFWELAAKNALPDETMNYVPKFIAAVIVAENYKKFGFAYNGPSKGADTVAEDVSKLVALDQYRRGSKPHKGGATVASNESSEGETTTYIVKRGDNLSRIAQKNEVTIADIRGCNHKLRGNTVNIGQRLIIGCSAKQVRIAKAEAKEKEKEIMAQATPVTNGKHKIYKVKHGDTLDAIARKNSLTIDSIKACNPTLKRYQILAGQKLKLTCGAGEEEPSAETVVATVVETPSKTIKKTNQYKIHVVRPGESLWTISQKYNVTISDLMAWNNLKKRSVIFKGRRLRVYNK